MTGSDQTRFGTARPVPLGIIALAGPGNFRLVKVDGDEEIPESVANREFTGDLILNSTIFRDVRIIGAIL